ncbi:MAG: HEAT repeat domain-containing protein, partial [Candidatus Bilamarchaeaceae archaeon]
LLILKKTDEVVAVGKPGVPVLIDALKDWNWKVRREAAEALGKIGVNEEQLKEITRMLKKGKTWEERNGAAIALGKIGDARAVPALIDALKDEDWNVRKRAAEALEKIAKKQQMLLNILLLFKS